MSHQLQTSNVTAPASVRLPRVSDLPTASVSSATPAETPSGEPNPIFSLLVRSEADTVGLLAYALYKQNKRDWLIAHSAKERRGPTQAEVDAFVLGESIPRRLATYRRLAEDHLASNAAGGAQPRLPIGLMASPVDNQSAVRTPGPGKPAVTWRYIAFLLAMLVAMAVVFRLAAAWLFGAR